MTMLLLDDEPPYSSVASVVRQKKGLGAQHASTSSCFSSLRWQQCWCAAVCTGVLRQGGGGGFQEPRLQTPACLLADSSVPLLAFPLAKNPNNVRARRLPAPLSW